MGFHTPSARIPRTQRNGNSSGCTVPVKLLNTWLVNIAGGQQQAVVHYYRRLVARDLVYGDVLSCSFDIGVLLY